MARAFAATAGLLTGRLLAALDAAETVGGDIRGRQSAANKVVAGRCLGGSAHCSQTTQPLLSDPAANQGSV